MRVDALHRRVVHDVRVMFDAVSEVLPVEMPRAYRTRAMNMNKFFARLNAVCEPFGVYNEVIEDKSVKENWMMNSGEWFAKSEQKDRPCDVRIKWHVHPSQRLFHWTQHQWARRRFFFFEILMHELIHRHQDQSAPGHAARVYRPVAEDKDLKEEQEYHGDLDEIETHAHMAVVEFITWWPGRTLAQSIRCAQSVTKTSLAEPTYIRFMSTFADCPQHPAVRHYKRKVRAWWDIAHKNMEFYETLQLPNII